MLLDIVCVSIDAQTAAREKTSFVEHCDNFLKIAQSILNIIILIAFVVLFIKFLILISKRYRSIRC